MERINNYFYDLSQLLLVPSGYHQSNITRKNDKISISLISKSKLKGVNKLIPYIIDNFFTILADVTFILRKALHPMKDVIFDDFISDETQIIIIFIEISNYLNPFIIPVDLLKLILNQLKNTDYLNLLNSLNFFNYPHLLDELADNKTLLINNLPQFKRELINEIEEIVIRL